MILVIDNVCIVEDGILIKLIARRHAIVTLDSALYNSK